MFIKAGNIEKEETKIYCKNMAKLNELNRQYFWKNGKGIWNPFSDVDCIMINKYHPFMKEINLLSKIGYKVIKLKNDQL